MAPVRRLQLMWCGSERFPPYVLTLTWTLWSIEDLSLWVKFQTFGKKQRSVINLDSDWPSSTKTRYSLHCCWVTARTRSQSARSYFAVYPPPDHWWLGKLQIGCVPEILSTWTFSITVVASDIWDAYARVLRDMITYHSGINKSVFKRCIAFQQLFLQEFSVSNILKQCNMNLISGRKMLELKTLQTYGSHFGNPKIALIPTITLWAVSTVRW